MRVLCDEMLGRLAKWLRLLGHDVHYLQGLHDDALLAKAEAEDLLLLTRDAALAARAPPGRAHLVRALEPEAQLAEVAKALPAVLAEAAPMSRCSLDNALLAPLPRAAAEGRVPPSVWATREEYWACAACGRVYWRGTHAERIEATLAALRAGAPPGRGP